jgi:NAD(P)-dependent dehydrogenase (short-subunit alcohol dehydrogenase family)
MPAALVTGSDSGIGKATAVQLARQGFDVHITYSRDEDGARATAAEVRAAGRAAVIHHLDLSDASAGAALAGGIEDLGVLVNNAGTGDPCPALDLPVDEFRTILEIDLVGAFACAQAAAKRWVADGRGGAIVNVTSVHEHIPNSDSAAYCAAKGGLGLLTKALALDWARHGIRVNAVAPGEISTPMTGQEDEDPHAQDRPGIPARRTGDAREVASLIGWLCSDDAAYVTGASYVIDGGLTLMAAMQEDAAPDG